jgi:ankyrin repeat protein
MRHAIGILTLGVLVAGTLSPIRITADAKSDLLAAVRNDDDRTVRMLLTAGADANVADDIGATALMNAVAFASVETARLLLDAGANVNASNRTGATALMWATAEPTKVRLLLDRGAAVNARTKDGTTALVTAARRGNLEVMKLLLARGANPKTDAAERTELLRILYGERPEIRLILADAGVQARGESQAAAPPLTTFPGVSNSAVVSELLDLGVSPNPRGRFPVLGSAAFEGHVESARALLERGAAPNATGPHGVTPLMMAAGATQPDPATVRLLLDKGVDKGARDEVGRTALDWALLQGDTHVAQLLREAGAPSGSPAAPPPAPVGPPRQSRAAVSEALARLQPGGAVLYERSKCISCHHQTLPLMAMARSKTHGIGVDETAFAHAVRSVTDVWNGRRDGLMAARSRDGGGANELTYGLVAFAEAGVPRSVVTDTAVVNLLSTQRTDGSWVFLDTRPPQADNSRIPFTAMAIRALNSYTPPGLRPQIRASIARALTFIRTASPASTQDEAFRLLGLVWSRVPSSEITAQTKRLIALQHTDGGWAQLPTMRPDAYATGEALYALAVSGMSGTDRVHRAGTGYLLRTQLDDGTWFVRSRAFGFQPYFETGFPHGIDQFISASATAWAIVALAHTL